MKRLSWLTVLLVLALLVTVAASAMPRLFVASLSGDQEATPVETDAFGRAIFHFNPTETRMKFTLRVANIEDVVAAHIHCAPPGQNGPVGVTLFMGGPVSFKHGVLAKEFVSAPNDGNACGWASLADVAAAMRAGNAYVNVHTLANPGGEIRGNIGAVNDPYPSPVR